MQTETQGSNQHSHKNRIMVVEDESITALSLQRSLEDMGYIVSSTVLSGEEAVKRAARDRPDLVLMDISLKGKMDGIEAAGMIHSQLNIPIIYLTAYSDEKVIQRIKATQPFGYITKPFHDNEISFALEIALDKKKKENRSNKNESQLKGHRTHLVNIVNELTVELKQTNDKLKQEIRTRISSEAEAKRSANLASIGELTAGVVHEINNPINGIINYAQILLNQSTEGSTESDIANRIIREGSRITTIVKDLRSFMQENGPEDGPIHIDKVLSNTLSLTASHLTLDQIQLTAIIPPNLPPVAGQSRLISQVFLNIINNAAHALNQKYKGAHKQKIITVKAGIIDIDEKQYIRASFHDNGIGIPDNDLDKVMEPFFTTKPSDEGTGMGLSISNGIVLNFGGNLSVYSVEGHCTDVVVDLPVICNSHYDALSPYLHGPDKTSELL